jgi:hypothetical protein
MASCHDEAHGPVDWQSLQAIISFPRHRVSSRLKDPQNGHGRSQSGGASTLANGEPSGAGKHCPGVS